MRSARRNSSSFSTASVPLGRLAEKYTVNELAAFLRDPLKARPAGRMPSLKLDAAEARAIAMYLLRAQVPAGEAAKLGGLAYEYYEENLPELPEFDRLHAEDDRHRGDDRARGRRSGRTTSRCACAAC